MATARYDFLIILARNDCRFLPNSTRAEVQQEINDYLLPHQEFWVRMVTVDEFARDVTDDFRAPVDDDARPPVKRFVLNEEAA